MKKIIMLFVSIIGMIFILTACDSVDVPLDETITYNVTYYLEEGESYFKQIVIEGEIAIKPTSPNKDNFIFEYWTLDDNQYSFETIIEKDIKLYAKWIEEKVEIKFYNGLILLEQLDIIINSTTVLLQEHVAEGLGENFIGWFLDQELTNSLNSITNFTQDISLYGKWETVSVVEPVNNLVVTEDGLYTSRDEVALYIETYHKLPNNYMTKAEANGNISSIWTEENKASIGGDVFGNRERLLPIADGRTFIELDIDYYGISRGASRIVYSSDFRIFYTDDHYANFVEYDKETREWKSY